jgi:GTP cyclohydrolase IA
VDVFSKRLQIQERLTRQIATAVEEHVGAAGVAVMVECGCVRVEGGCSSGCRAI